MLAENIIISFDGNHADIPSGFTRETTLDGLYPKATADGVNPNDTDGGATHTHTSPNHTHTLANHTHTGLTTYSGVSQGNTTNQFDAQRLRNTHRHSYTSGNPSSGTTVGTAVTYAAVSNDPDYYTVIFIKADSYITIPNDAMMLKEGSTRDGLTFHAASASKFLKGAGTGVNAGDTGGGTENIHSIDHTHTTANHTHTATSGGESDNTKIDRTVGDPPALTAYGHTHTISLTGAKQAIVATTVNLTTAETVQPAYKTLNAFKNDSGGNIALVAEDIAMWLGSLASIPTGWNLCDGTNSTPDMRGKWFKNNASATTSSTGGSNTHTHAAQNHTHGTGATHTHAGTVSAHVAGDKPTGGGTTIPKASDEHTLDTCSSTAVAYAAGSTTGNSSSNEPEYRTVAYIQFEFPLVLPNPILNMMIDTVENND